MDKVKQAEVFRLLEIKNTNLQKERLAGTLVPTFDFGLDFLQTTKSPDTFLKHDLWKYADSWFEDLAKYLRPDHTISSTVLEQSGFLSFPSLLDRSQVTKFKYDPQPNSCPGRKVALIHVMHWNGRLTAYDRVITFLRRMALPISTLIHIPAGRGLNPGKDEPADYESVGPNIGKTIFRARQDIHDIQYIARHLKERMGYEQVGLFTYSIGSMRGLIASVMSPTLFDFGIFHMVSDDFTEALMDGVATTSVARAIEGNIDRRLLQSLWSTISPGAYSQYFSALPKNTRIVQCAYDFVFGLDNVARFNSKVMAQRPDVELEIAPLSHTSLGSFPIGWEIMARNIRYIYKHSFMNEYRRSALFL